ncbi:MAG TPA: TIGR02281 family clan AA aspartic protease [Candidatus Eisenbacteria bacterium]|nr:TIGR02281 family clan AA aspartic protease [Candidatus Eisenbacteria bacterium]
MKPLAFELLVLCSVLAATSPSRAAEFYRWTDQNGVVHFTDNLHNIPEKQRPGAKRIRGKETPREPETAKPAAPSKVSVPFEKNGSIVIVDARVNGKASAKLIVDTGASYTMISSAMARELGIEADPGRRTVPFHTANGIIQAPLADLESVAVGGVEVKNLTAAIHDALPNTRVAGLLGLNFLSNFRMDIDTEKGLLHLEKK